MYFKRQRKPTPSFKRINSRNAPAVRPNEQSNNNFGLLMVQSHCLLLHCFGLSALGLRCNFMHICVELNKLKMQHVDFFMHQSPPQTLIASTMLIYKHGHTPYACFWCALKCVKAHANTHSVNGPLIIPPLISGSTVKGKRTLQNHSFF